MARKREPWIIRTYAGFGDAVQTNQRYRDNLARGQRGLSVAFDLPTQCGYDPDHPLSLGEVGKAGVSVAHIGDMRALFDGVDLAAINTSMTINATAPWLYALYLALADERGIDRSALRGTTQNDLLKEFVARGTYVFDPATSLRLTTDLICAAVTTSPRWNPINCCGYHLMESGARPEEEVGFAVAGALIALDAVRERLDKERFAAVVRAISFFINSGIELIPEIAKVRCFAELWPAICAERYGVQTRFRAGCQVRSLTLAAAQPEVNIVRIALQALPVLLSADARVGALQLPGFREALGLPDEAEQVLSLRTQQVLMHETGIADWPDIFAGSAVIEGETARMRAAAETIIERSLARGYKATIGVLGELLSRRVNEYQAAIESGERPLVGVNVYTDAMPIAGPAGAAAGEADAATGLSVRTALDTWRAARDDGRWRSARAELIERMAASDSIIEASVAFARAGGTTGEWTEALLTVVGPRHVQGLGTGNSSVATGDSSVTTPTTGRRLRLLLAKAGLDGHVNALRLLAVSLRDAGMEVIYAGPGLTPAAIANAAVQEAVDVIGLSSLSGNHLQIVAALRDELAERGAGELPILLGGIVPASDRSALAELGVAEVFGPGSRMADIVVAVRAATGAQRAV